MFYRKVCYPIPYQQSLFPACLIFEDSPPHSRRHRKLGGSAARRLVIQILRLRLLIFYMLRVSRKSSHCSQAQRKMASITPVTRIFCAFVWIMLKLIKAAILTAVLRHFFILATFSHTDRTEAQWPSKGHISPLHAFCTLRESTTRRTDFSLGVPASGRMHDTHEMKAQKTQILGAHKRTWVPPPCVGADKEVDTTISVFFTNRERTCITIGIQTCDYIFLKSLHHRSIASKIPNL